MSFSDPIEPPEPEEKVYLKAGDLKNKVCLFRPTAHGKWDDTPATEDKPEKAGNPFVACDVWVLDRAGIVESGTNVKISWWRAYEQLKPVAFGEFIMAKPTEQPDRSIILMKVSRKDWEQVGTAAVQSICSQDAEDEFLDGGEPF